ncbi:hypothetical protein niasHT_026342 [Heterodera trifolii]|uniref:Uncharacterized protein n=1 Tax=Heterodera trifolii TaxID=157864 RepID=A0ABD2JHE4_9BILA
MTRKARIAQRKRRAAEEFDSQLIRATGGADNEGRTCAHEPGHLGFLVSTQTTLMNLQRAGLVAEEIFCKKLLYDQNDDEKAEILAAKVVRLEERIANESLTVEARRLRVVQLVDEAKESARGLILARKTHFKKLAFMLFSTRVLKRKDVRSMKEEKKETGSVDDEDGEVEEEKDEEETEESGEDEDEEEKKVKDEEETEEEEELDDE